jgi:hypothetical protein
LKIPISQQNDTSFPLLLISINQWCVSNFRLALLFFTSILLFPFLVSFIFLTNQTELRFWIPLVAVSQ